MKTSAMIKHETQVLSKTLIAFGFVFALSLLLSSCNNDDERFDTDKEDTDATQFDALDDYYQEDAEDLAVAVFETTESDGGRAADNDTRLACATITRTGDDTAGSITIDFGEGCTDGRGNIRRGTIVIEYEGRWMSPGSSWSLSFTNYYINDILIAGTRMITNISEGEEGTQVFTVVLENGSMTWPDGSIARRTAHRTREFERDGNNILNRLIIYGTAEGNHRNGRGYAIEITEPLVYDRACAEEGVIIPVSGEKIIKHGQREITVNYGDGTCDNVVTITNKNGRTWSYTVKTN